MKAAVVSLGSVSSTWILKAMRKYFSSVEDINLNDVEVDVGGKRAVALYKGRKLDEYDCVYLRGSFKYLPILYAISSALADKVCMPIRPSGFLIGHDKMQTHLVLQKENIPMPDTFISASPSAAKQLLERLSYPIVMKFPSGTQGKGVMFADSYTSAASMLDALSALNQPVILQKYIETGGKDIRAIVVGGKVVAAMERQAVEGEKRANIHAGGKGKKIVLTDADKDLAVLSAKSVGADICAVDMLKEGKKTMVIEVNLSPGLQGITEATKIDVADRLARRLYEMSKKFKGTADAEGPSLDGDHGTTIVTAVKLSKKKLVLPEIVTGISGFKNDDEILIACVKNRVVVTKSKKVE